MALNYVDRETLRPLLVPRCKEAVRKYLLYVQGGGGSPSQERIDFCTASMTNLSGLAEQVSHYCTSETAFIDTGTSITDAALQSRVEVVLNAFFMPA
jgi:hypothetical protein